MWSRLQPQLEHPGRRHQPDRADAAGAAIDRPDRPMRRPWRSASTGSCSPTPPAGRSARSTCRGCAGRNIPATVAIGRPALHDVLLQPRREEQGAAITLGTTVSALDQSADAVDVDVLQRRRARPTTSWSAATASTRRCASWHSTSVPAASFTGLAVWRATMPRPNEVDCMQMFYGPQHQGRRQPAFARRDVPVPGAADQRRPAPAAGPDARPAAGAACRFQRRRRVVRPRAHHRPAPRSTTGR